MCVCFANSDSNDARALTVPSTVIDRQYQYNQTIESCLEVCAAASYSKAGVEFANECCACFTL